MAKPELGTKRTCPNCGAKYYDLNRDPIVCPRCGTHFEAANTRVRAQAAPEPEEEEEDVVPEPAEAEFVTLEEADEETADAGVVAVEGVEDEEVEAGEEDTFLEESDEGGDDVTDIIGGVEDEEP